MEINLDKLKFLLIRFYKPISVTLTSDFDMQLETKNLNDYYDSNKTEYLISKAICYTNNRSNYNKS